MDIKKKIEELKAERSKQLEAKSKAHDRAVEINKQIGKLETILKHAGEILFEDAPEKAEQEV